MAVTEVSCSMKPKQKTETAMSARAAKRTLVCPKLSIMLVTCGEAKMLATEKAAKMKPTHSGLTSLASKTGGKKGADSA